MPHAARGTAGHRHCSHAQLQCRRAHAIAPPYARYSAAAPGSDQFHEETGTSNGIQLAVGPQPLWLRNHNFGLAQRIMIKRLATSPHDPLGITDSACKNQLVVVSLQYGPFNIYIPIRSMTIGKSRVARDPITMHISWRSNSDIASVTRVSMTFRVVRTNQYNQDLGLIHSTNGNHLENPNEGSSIDHQVTIHLHAQNITMFPTNETCLKKWTDTQHICFWKFGPQCPTSPLLPPRKDPLNFTNAHQPQLCD
ncbi:ent-kaur-16-ene synthase, chloroplastic [Dorcoceras hygrometricum]|uniref:Ent-kaur-16-ene synthase, chloroplastic n=1 Tax=Dorcoceras hygrometricum TaxID=472368 RepID=A0A2Z7CJ79_9LAMI|nr:ent-kaur-16-ene synthase, chloroplastic [Dorcoceras hygrometricum]